MDVERNVRRIQREIVPQEGPDPPVSAVRHRPIAVPEKPVVYQDQRRRLKPGHRRNGAVDGGLRRINGGDEAADRAAILDLKPVDGPALVRHFPDPKEVIEIADHLAEQRRGHRTTYRPPSGWSVPAVIESCAAASLALRAAGMLASSPGFG